MRSWWSRRPSSGEWLFLALAGYVAKLLGTAVHEVVGHGMVALALGGRFHDVFVSPLSGQAGASASGALNAAVLASGSLSEIVFGAMAWLWLRRRLAAAVGTARSVDYVTVLLWLFATQAILDSVIYVSFAPTLQLAYGTATGDWPLLLRSHPAARALLLIAGLVAIVPVTAGLLREASVLCRAHLEGVLLREADARAASLGRRAANVLIPYVTLLLPSMLLLAAYAVGFSPWLDTSLPIVIGSILDLLLLGLPAALWVAWRDASGARRSPMGSLPGTIGSRPAWRWNGGLACVAVATLAAFGPTEALRQGLPLSAPDGDQYIATAQLIRVHVHLSRTGNPVASIHSQPRDEAGGRYRRHLTRSLAARGPSSKGAREMSEFVARWNLGGAAVGRVSPVRAGEGGWTWQFELVGATSPMEIALWPVTWVSESWIREVRVEGGLPVGVAVPNVRVEASDPPVVVWSRPDDKQDVQRFQVEWKQD